VLNATSIWPLVPQAVSERLAAVEHAANLKIPGSVRIGATQIEPVSRLASGLAGMDTWLDGGLPRGRISEILGASSSGKTSFLLTLLAAATQRGEVVAYVDLPDALHPGSAFAAGVALQRLLWVRPTSAVDGVRCAELVLRAKGFGLVVLDLGASFRLRLPGSVWLRLLRAAEQSHTALVVLGSRQITESLSALGLQFHAPKILWQSGRTPLFEGFEISVLLARNKLGQASRRCAPLSVLHLNV